ncbi:uncharacterized protein LOC144576313 [Carex rostrata]
MIFFCLHYKLLPDVQEKYEEAMALLAQLEKRAVMAEIMLEATIQYQSSQGKAQQPSSPSPRTPTSQELPQDNVQPRRISLLARPFGWLDKNKGKQSNKEAKGSNIEEAKPNPDDAKPSTEESKSVNPEGSMQKIPMMRTKL